MARAPRSTNITWNSNPRKPKNRELLDPRVKKALSMCVDRDKMIQVVFSGYATKVESLVGHISPLENPNLGPIEVQLRRRATQMLDKLGYKRGSDGIRVAPATTGQVRAGRRTRCATRSSRRRRPTSTSTGSSRSSRRVSQSRRQGHAAGRRRLDGGYALETDSNAMPEEHRLHEVRHRDVGLGRLLEPDFSSRS